MYIITTKLFLYQYLTLCLIIFSFQSSFRQKFYKNLSWYNFSKPYSLQDLHLIFYVELYLTYEYVEDIFSNHNYYNYLLRLNMLILAQVQYKSSFLYICSIYYPQLLKILNKFFNAYLKHNYKQPSVYFLLLIKAVCILSYLLLFII